MSPRQALTCGASRILDQVFEKMYEETRGNILIISHQERILSIADKIVVIRDGKVDRVGSRDEILPGLLKSADAGNTTCDILTQKAMS